MASGWAVASLILIAHFLAGKNGGKGEFGGVVCILQLQPCIAISKEAPLATARKGLVRTVTSSSPR